MKGNKVEATEKTVLHCEAEIGSSIFDIQTINCGAIQLLGLAEVLHAHGMAALAADMQRAQHRTIDIATVMPSRGLS